MTKITSNIQEAIDLLNNNEVVAIPTETVYGLAGNIYSDKALNKIYELKKRPHFNPLIVHVNSIDKLKLVAKEIPEKALQLANAFWPGPLTLILKKQDSISSIISAGKETVAVRVPNHPIALELLNRLDFPLAAPSANPFTSISPTSSQHVFEYFNTELPLILEGGNCEKGVESTIIGFENNNPVLYRHGSISIEEIEKEVGKVTVFTNDDVAPNAPGMLKKHYAPKTPIILTKLVNDLIEKYKGQKIGLLVFNSKIDNDEIKHQEIVSPNNNLNEAAANLYAALHKLDKLDLDLIIAEEFPNFGLGKTINDRLKRASE
jgi:L-threonylcarbamoyladenylate synthase